MSKAVLIIDMPESCYECLNARDDAYYCICGHQEDDEIEKYEHSRPDWRPLIPFPEKVDNCIFYTEYDEGYENGWNACLDKTIEEVKNEK